MKNYEDKLQGFLIGAFFTFLMIVIVTDIFQVNNTETDIAQWIIASGVIISFIFSAKSLKMTEHSYNIRMAQEAKKEWEEARNYISKISDLQKNYDDLGDGLFDILSEILNFQMFLISSLYFPYIANEILRLMRKKKVAVEIICIDFEQFYKKYKNAFFDNYSPLNNIKKNNHR